MVSGKRIVEWPFIPLEAYVQQLLWHRGRGRERRRGNPFLPPRSRRRKGESGGADGNTVDPGGLYWLDCLYPEAAEWFLKASEV